MRRVTIALAILLLAGVTMSAQRTSSRRHIKLGGQLAQLPFSNGVLANNTLYLAGVIGIDRTTNRPPDDLEAEIRMALDQMKAVLAEADMTMDDLVSVQVFCPDLSLFPRFNAVYRTYFTKDLPARAFIGSGPLLFGGHFEIQGVAVKR